MEKPVKGDVVIVPFPFSDLSTTKKRPALVIATLLGDDLILCQITSQANTDSHAIILLPQDFQQGKLHIISRIRPNKLFTADRSLILYKIGRLKPAKIEEVEKRIISIITQEQ